MFEQLIGQFSRRLALCKCEKGQAWCSELGTIRVAQSGYYVPTLQGMTSVPFLHVCGMTTQTNHTSIPQSTHFAVATRLIACT